jgi:hypothetical protein
MLTTDKNEIIESICKDLEEASDSALTQLAKTFGVPLQDESESIGTKSISTLGSTGNREVYSAEFEDGF